jgi:hypothetical protein
MANLLFSGRCDHGESLNLYAFIHSSKIKWQVPENGAVFCLGVFHALSASKQ